MGMPVILFMWPGSFEQTFIPHPMDAPHEIWLQLAQRFLKKRSLKCWIWETLDEGQWLTLTFDIQKGSLLI